MQKHSHFASLCVAAHGMFGSRLGTGTPRRARLPSRVLYVFIALATPLLCSCRTALFNTAVPRVGATAGLSGSAPHGSPMLVGAGAAATTSLPPEAYTGHPGDGFTRAGAVPAHMRPPGWEPPTAHGPPLPRMVYGPWAPPGIAVPWPRQEYLRDGGDRDTRVIVRDDWRVDGLDLEDTVAHFDTLDGRTLVSPSNEICLYAPRFSAVRRVDNVFEGEQQAKAGGHTQPVALIGYEEKQFAATKMQPLQPIGDVESRRPNIAKQRELGVPMFVTLIPITVQDRLLPHEDFAIFRTGVMETAEKPFIAKAALAAVVWASDQAVQVILEGRKAQADVLVQAAEVTYRVDAPGNPELRLCKTASTTSALPGEEVHFTLRFDNVGGETIGNVTIIDNLTTRLEYVPDTAQSSLKANFSVKENEGESLTLRWEIDEPLAPGEGGIVRFTCRVR